MGGWRCEPREMSQPSACRVSALPLLKATVAAWMKDRALNLSAALAYYSIFSIAPLLMIAISVAGLVFGAEAVRGQLDGQLKIYIGAEAAAGVQSLIKSAAKPTHGWMGAILGFVTLLLGASGVFGQLKEALNTVWSVQAKPGAGLRGLLRERLLNFGMVLVIGFLLLVSLLVTSLLAALNAYLNHWLGLPTGLWMVLSFAVSVSVVTTLFALIFKVLPDAKVQWRDVWIGAVVTALLFEVGKFGLSFYLGQESTASSFGAAGSVILVLLWIYYASCILLFGAEFTRAYATAKGRVIQPSKNAEPATSVPPTLAPASLVSAREPAREILPFPPPSRPSEVPAPPTPSFGAQVGRFLAVAGTAFIAGRVLGRKKEPEIEDGREIAANEAGDALAASVPPRREGR